MKKLLYLLISCILPLFVIAQNPVRDSTFSFDGHVATTVGLNNEAATSVVVQSDRKIIAGGTQTDHPIYGPQQFALVRYLTDGSLDTSFGSGGKVISSFLSQNFCNVVKLQPDEKILTAGQASTGICIARYLSNGNLDSAFGVNGFTTVVGALTRSINDLEILPGGKVIAAGIVSIGGVSDYGPLLIQFNSDGSIDTNFGINGFADPVSGFTSVSVRKILVQNDGKFVIGGSCRFDPGTGEVNQLFLMRCESTGNIDSTFGINGVATYPSALNINDMAFDANANIVAVGEIGTNPQGTSGNVVVLRFLPDGSEDNSFGTNGSTTVNVDSYADYANAIVIDPNGGILLGGSYFNFSGGSGTDCMIIRFLQNGLVDTTFGDDGVFKTGVSSGTDMIQDMAITPDYKIVVSGSANYGVNFDFIVGQIITDVTLSTGEFSNMNDMMLYPNPANDFLIINSVKNNYTILNAEIFDARGKLIYSSGKNLSREYPVEVDISHLGSGIYFMKLFEREKISTLKFIKH
jgi:uncharacterized delta-60 repeat protein